MINFILVSKHSFLKRKNQQKLALTLTIRHNFRSGGFEVVRHVIHFTGGTKGVQKVAKELDL